MTGRPKATPDAWVTDPENSIVLAVGGWGPCRARQSGLRSPPLDRCARCARSTDRPARHSCSTLTPSLPSPPFQDLPPWAIQSALASAPLTPLTPLMPPSSNNTGQGRPAHDSVQGVCHRLQPALPPRAGNQARRRRPQRSCCRSAAARARPLLPPLPTPSLPARLHGRAFRWSASAAPRPRPRLFSPSPTALSDLYG